MSSYMHGNLAVKKEPKPEVQYRTVKTTIRRSGGISALEKLLYLSMITLCVIISGTVIWKHAQIYDVNTKIQKMEREIARIDKENQALKLEVRRMKDPDRMMEMGKTMGFAPIASEKVSLLNVDNSIKENLAIQE